MPLEGRVIGLDAGDVRIGVAVSDGLGLTAQPRGTIDASSPEADAEAVRALVEENRAVAVVVGLPLDRQGEAGHQGKKVLALVEKLREVLDVPVETIDERFTTAAVRRGMSGAGVSRKKQKSLVDQLAAQQILQTWLDRRDRAGS